MTPFFEGADLTINENELPFKLLGNLGHGHSGNVEKVQDEYTGKVYARKVIAIRSNRSRSDKEKIFWNEVRIIRSLEKHWHMISVFATYMARREFGILLEPVADEGDLSRFLDRVLDSRAEDNVVDSAVPQDMLLTLQRAFGCLASGLAFMHTKRIRHKDIKPQNILIHRGTVIYTDFGYSLNCTALSNSTTEGFPDSLTRRYSAPEVLAKEPRNRSADIYSLGCVYLEILAVLGTGDGDLCPRDNSFAEDMEEIHEVLREWSIPESLRCTRSIVVAMTDQQRSMRPSSESVYSRLRSNNALSCEQCMRIDPKQDGGRVQRDVTSNLASTIVRSSTAEVVDRQIHTQEEVKETFSPPLSVRLHPSDTNNTQSFRTFSPQYDRWYEQSYDSEHGWKFKQWLSPEIEFENTIDGHILRSNMHSIEIISKMQRQAPEPEARSATLAPSVSFITQQSSIRNFHERLRTE